MSYSRRQLYALGEPLGESVTRKEGGRIIYGGGGGGQSAPTTSTTYTQAIPAYAQPYVETMLGTAQQQVYNYDPSGTVTGIKPYVPYSEDPSKYVAPFSPLQGQAFTGAAQLQTPGQFGMGTGATAQGAMGTMGTTGALGGYGQMAQRQLTDPRAQQAYMSPYIQNALQPTLQEMQRQYGITGAQEASKATGMGAFGGTRQALMQAENERNKNIAMNKAIGEGYQQAFTQGQAAQQANLNLGLQGLQGAQSGYGQLGQLGTQLGQLGTAQLAAQQGVIGTQAQQGALQQAQQQNIINQAIQNYAMAQQYPQTQLGFMSSLLHGLPLQATQTAGYQAAPSTVSQLAGLGTAGLGAYGLYNAATKKKGGAIKEKGGTGIDMLALHDAMKGC